MKVRALDSFDHNGKRSPDDVFEVSEHIAAQLVRKGLAEAIDKQGAKPPLAEDAGKEQLSSVSPADQVFVPKTSRKSKLGGKHKAKSKE